VAGVVALLLVAAGCGPVDVPDTSVSASERKACESLVEALPDQVADQSSRDTSGNPLGAAWGDPAIVLRCGAGTPKGYDKFAGCQTVNGLDWFVPTATIEDQEADVVLTTIGRTPAVEVTVPASYRPPDAVMVDVAPAIKQHTRVTRRCS
jgi:Protein of unknown function (DUF3515)